MSTKTSMHIKMRKDLLKHLKSESSRTGKTMTRIIEDALDDSFNGVSEQLADANRRLIAAGETFGHSS
tara:strand:+ start:75 stop:278 length:204 start_codon:yes stop_codon:yes gene_type:complete